jgi:DNA-binding NarL/FixJ family response regulator
MASETAAVAIIADEPSLAGRLRSALESSELDCAIEAVSLEQLASDESLDRIGVLVLRLGTTRDQVLGAFKNACALLPDTPIVGIWPDGLRREDRRALMTGVDGLLAENQIEGALLSTVRAVRSGLICLPQRRPQGAQAESLSSREKQVLGMLIMGFTNAEIGRRLYLAESTVKSHLSSAYTKLGVRSRKDAAALILDPNGGLGTGILAISGA